MTNGAAILISVIALLTTVVSVAFAIYFGLKSSRRSDNSEVEKKATEQATINVKLDQIGGDVRDIKYDVTGVKKDFQMLSERTYKLEEKCALQDEKNKVVNNRIKDLEERDKVS